MKYLGIILLILFASILCKIEAETYEECEGVTMLTFVGNSRNCSKYIFCDGEDSYEGDCDEGDYFNSIYQTCDAKELVQCRFDAISNEEHTTTTKENSNLVLTTEALESLHTTTKTTTTATISTEITTENWSNFLIDSTITTTRVTTTRTTPTTTTPSTRPTTTSNPLVWAVASPAEGETCPKISDPYRIFYIRSPRSCSDYFICYRGLSIKMHCAGMLHFNAATGQCDYPELAKCDVYLHVSPREQCQPYKNDYYPHDSNCNYFYHCKRGFLFLEHCPVGYGWDYERRVCTKINFAKCYKKREKLQKIN